MVSLRHGRGILFGTFCIGHCGIKQLSKIRDKAKCALFLLNKFCTFTRIALQNPHATVVLFYSEHNTMHFRCQHIWRGAYIVTDGVEV